jgi:hypothetical protein
MNARGVRREACFIIITCKVTGRIKGQEMGCVSSWVEERRREGRRATEHGVERASKRERENIVDEIAIRSMVQTRMRAWCVCMSGSVSMNVCVCVCTPYVYGVCII